MMHSRISKTLMGELAARRDRRHKRDTMTDTMQQTPPQYSSRQRAIGSLLAVALVLLVCWGQMLNATACPFQANAVVELGGETSGTDTSDCEMSGQLLSGHAYGVDAGIPASFALLTLLLGFGGRPAWSRSRDAPFTLKRRQHLYFCVFGE